MAVRVHLLGHFEARDSAGEVMNLRARRVQEFLSYVLLSKKARLQREHLACRLWQDVGVAEGKKHLRHAMWQVRRAFAAETTPGGKPLLDVDQEWIGINEQVAICVDVWELERAHESAMESPKDELSPGLRARVTSAVKLYRGELLEHWDHDWCLYHRDACRTMYVALLNRLVQDAAASGSWESGLAYGRRALQEDPASEKTHTLMMRLHHMAGDRTGALRQFELCRTALMDELGVKPDESTTRLHEMILGSRSRADAEPSVDVPRSKARVHTMLARLRELHRSLTELQDEVATHIGALEQL